MIVSVITGIGFGSIQLSPSDVVKGLFGPSDFQWQAVDAVRKKKIIYLPQQYFLFNGGPNYPDSVAYMAASVHPEIFGKPIEP